MTIWLMDAKEVDKIEAVLNREIDADTAEKIQAVEHQANSVMINGSGVGVINISGALMPHPNPMLDFFGVNYTAYSDVNKQIEALEEDRSVKGIKLNINSPGGNIQGMYDTMNSIAGTSKPIVAKTTGTLASAAYMLASQADAISSKNELDMIGSVGVVTGGKISKSAIEVTNTASPKKRNDLSTEDGIKNTEATLDDVWEIIEGKMSSGRGVDIETIRSNYGQGALMTARTALKNGMIDSIGSSNVKNKEFKTSGISGQKKESKMETLAELKASHPDLYATCFNTGVEAGKKEYQQLACNHLELAGLSGAMDRAVEDIKAGNEVTPAVSTYHSIQGIKKAQIDARGEESPVVVGEGESPIDAAHEGINNKKETEEAQALFAKLGVEVE